MTHCPRCGSRSLYYEMGDVCCLSCGTLRAEPNPDALLDKQRSQRPAVLPMLRPHEAQIPMEFERPTVVYAGQKVRCVVCAKVVVQTATRARMYCGNACKQRNQRRRVSA